MPTYRPTGDKRSLTLEEEQQRVIASGYSYIPSGGLKPEPIVAKPKEEKAPEIRKPVIVQVVKPGAKIEV